jgi:hypothetical protein
MRLGEPPVEREQGRIGALGDGIEEVLGVQVDAVGLHVRKYLCQRLASRMNPSSRFGKSEP